MHIGLMFWSHNAHPWACAWPELLSRFLKKFICVPPHPPGLCSCVCFKAFSSLENRIVYSTKGLFMDTLLDWIAFFSKNWSYKESCAFAFTVLGTFCAELIRMASVQTHSCVSQPCPQPVVITCLSCSSLFCLDHTPQDNICGCGEPVCELNPAWNVTSKPFNVQTPDVNLARKSRDVGIQCDMELYELNRGLAPLVWPHDWVADNSDAPEIHEKKKLCQHSSKFVLC
jgi:hypothetical protein